MDTKNLLSLDKSRFVRMQIIIIIIFCSFDLFSNKSSVSECDP